MDKTPQQIKEEVLAAFGRNISEAQSISIADGDKFLVCRADDYTPFRNDGKHIALFGGDVALWSARGTAQMVSGRLNRLYKERGIKGVVVVMVAAEWAPARIAALEALRVELDKLPVQS